MKKALSCLVLTMGLLASTATPMRNALASDRLPVILVQGAESAEGFVQNPADLVPVFAQKGYQLLVAQMPAGGTMEERARALAEEIQRLVPVGKAHLIGQGTGGLEARMAIHQFQLGDRVQTLTTVATPHHGTPVADYVVNKAGMTASNAVAATPAKNTINASRTSKRGGKGGFGNLLSGILGGLSGGNRTGVPNLGGGGGTGAGAGAGARAGIPNLGGIIGALPMGGSGGIGGGKAGTLIPALLRMFFGGKMDLAQVLTPENMAGFNSANPNDQLVQYFSIAAALAPEILQYTPYGPYVQLAQMILSIAGERMNDGSTGAGSAQWGNFLGFFHAQSPQSRDQMYQSLLKNLDKTTAVSAAN